MASVALLVPQSLITTSVLLPPHHYLGVFLSIAHVDMYMCTGFKCRSNVSSKSKKIKESGHPTLRNVINYFASWWTCLETYCAQE